MDNTDGCEGFRNTITQKQNRKNCSFLILKKARPSSPLGRPQTDCKYSAIVDSFRQREETRKLSTKNLTAPNRRYSRAA